MGRPGLCEGGSFATFGTRAVPTLPATDVDDRRAGHAEMQKGLAPVTCCLAVGVAAASSRAPLEIGTVKWLTSFRAAKAESGRTGKPIFLQFTEIPG
jgi:hypothetical protein